MNLEIFTEVKSVTSTLTERLFLGTFKYFILL